MAEPTKYEVGSTRAEVSKKSVNLEKQLAAGELWHKRLGHVDISVISG